MAVDTEADGVVDGHVDEAEAVFGAREYAHYRVCSFAGAVLVEALGFWSVMFLKKEEKMYGLTLINILLPGGGAVAVCKNWSEMASTCLKYKLLYERLGEVI